MAHGKRNYEPKPLFLERMNALLGKNLQSYLKAIKKESKTPKEEIEIPKKKCLEMFKCPEDVLCMPPLCVRSETYFEVISRQNSEFWLITVPTWPYQVYILLEK